HAATNLQRHVLRALRRFTVLVVADLASFYVMRELLRTVRDYAWFGERVAERLGDLLPPGILNGWQYAAALFVALFLTGNYGRGAMRSRVQPSRAAATTGPWGSWTCMCRPRGTHWGTPRTFELCCTAREQRSWWSPAISPTAASGRS